MEENIVRDKRQDGIDKSQFLTGLSLVLGKYGLSWNDMNIDFDKGIINIKTDMKPEAILNFLTEVEKTAGTFD